MNKVKLKGMIGTTRGILTLKEIIDDKNGMFYCETCDREHVDYLHTWYHNGRKQCKIGKTKHRLYGRYIKMLARCNNPEDFRYNYYGARGIKVCKRWERSFNNFIDDMEDSFVEGTELDRIDNLKGYYPENCRWVSHSVNMSNRRNFKNKTNYPGVKKTKYNTYIGRLQRNHKSYRTKSFKSPKEAYEAIQKIKKTL